MNKNKEQNFNVIYNYITRTINSQVDQHKSIDCFLKI